MMRIEISLILHVGAKKVLNDGDDSGLTTLRKRTHKSRDAAVVNDRIFFWAVFECISSSTINGVDDLLAWKLLAAAECGMGVLLQDLQNLFLQRGRDAT
jgi:hypothetical protein